MGFALNATVTCDELLNLERIVQDFQFSTDDCPYCGRIVGLRHKATCPFVKAATTFKKIAEKGVVETNVPTKAKEYAEATVRDLLSDERVTVS